MPITSPDTNTQQKHFINPVKKNFISAIIPVYKDAIGLTDTLNSLKNQTIPQSKFEIIVANDGADSQISKVCKEFKVKEVKITPNQGSYNARNQALKESKGAYLAFTDADVKVPSHWLETAINYLKEYQYIGGPINIDETKVHTVAHYYELYNAFKVKEYYAHDHAFPTANMCTTRHVFQTIGVFEARLRSSGDFEFGRRTHEANIPSKFIDQLYVTHPPRNATQILKKAKRIHLGKQKLHQLYPDRFPLPQETIIQKLSQAYTPPGIDASTDEIKHKYQLILFKYFLQFHKFYLQTKYPN